MATERSVMAVIRAARPSFRNNYDKSAFVVHASLLASGLVLTATGNPAFSDSAMSSSSTDEVGIDGWDEVDGEYAFVYVNPEKGNKKVLVKCLVMNDRLLVSALTEGIAEPLYLEINVGEYVGEDGNGNYSQQFKNLDKLVKSLESEILSKLEGPSKASSTSNLRSSDTREESTTHITDPIIRVPDSSDQVYASGLVFPPLNPIGGSDLFPGPPAGTYPRRGDFGGGSMLLGPNDPRWFGGGGGELGFPGTQPGVPPGARFDPYGPPGIPGFEPNRFTRGPRRPGGGTHPDLEHFGSGSDFI